MFGVKTLPNFSSGTVYPSSRAKSTIIKRTLGRIGPGAVWAPDKTKAQARQDRAVEVGLGGDIMDPRGGEVWGVELGVGGHVRGAVPANLGFYLQINEYPPVKRGLLYQI